MSHYFLGQDKFIPDGWEALRQHGLTNSVCLRGKRKMAEVNLCWELTLGGKNEHYFDTFQLSHQPLFELVNMKESSRV